MATVSFSIARDSGVVLNATSEIDDAQVVEMAGMIGAMIFDASMYIPPVEEPALP